MIAAQEFLGECQKWGRNFFTGTPCSYLKPFINYVIDHDGLKFVDATNEGDAIALAAGAAIAGQKACVIFQNSGLGNAVNPLTSLTHTFRIPLLIIITLRGDPEGAADEPQHELMGRITPALLDTMELKWAYFPQNLQDIGPAVAEAEAHMEKLKRPFVFIMRKGDILPYELQEKRILRRDSYFISHQDDFPLPYDQRGTRKAALQLVQEEAGAMTGASCALIATTGKTGRELYELVDLANQFYMVGSMGCALAFGLGVALNRPSQKIIVLDGDGALLMRTGSMATVGAYAPDNLIHILLDNEAHDSTGGQSTVSGMVSFGAIAKGFYYKNVHSTDSLKIFRDYLLSALASASTQGPSFIHLKIKKGSGKELGRPKVTPVEVAARFSQFLTGKK